MGRLAGAVQNSVGQSWVGHRGVPLVDRELARQDRRAQPGAVLHDLEQVPAGFDRGRAQEEIVEHEDGYPGQLGKRAGVTAVGTPERQVVEQPGARRYSAVCPWRMAALASAQAT